MKAIRIGKWDYAMYMYINRERTLMYKLKKDASNNNAVSELTK